MPHFPDEIEYSDKYADDFYEYRHVILVIFLKKSLRLNNKNLFLKKAKRNL
jgi:hypothetical protein